MLSVRERSCFCAGCRGDGPCLHTDLTGPWSVCNIIIVTPGNARRRRPPVDQARPPRPVDDRAPPPPPVDDQAPQSQPVDDQAPPPMDDQAPRPPPVDNQAPPPPPVDDQVPPPPPVDDQPADQEPSSRAADLCVFILSLTLISCSLQNLSVLYQ